MTDSTASAQDQAFLASVRQALLFLHPIYAGGRAPRRTLTPLAGDGLLRHGGEGAALEVVRILLRRLGCAAGEHLTLVVGPRHMTLLGKGGRPVMIAATSYRPPAAEQALAQLLAPAAEICLPLGRADNLTQHQRLAASHFLEKARAAFGATPETLAGLIDDAIGADAILLVERAPGLVQLWLRNEAAPDQRLKLLHSFPVLDEPVEPVLANPDLTPAQRALHDVARHGLIIPAESVSGFEGHPGVMWGSRSDIDHLLALGLVHRVDMPRRRTALQQPDARPSIQPAEVATKTAAEAFAACGSALSRATIAIRLI